MRLSDCVAVGRVVFRPEMQHIRPSEGNRSGWAISSLLRIVSLFFSSFAPLREIACSSRKQEMCSLASTKIKPLSVFGATRSK